MTFGTPHWFWAMLIIPFLVALFGHAERQATVRLREFVSERLLPSLAGTVDRRRRLLRFALLLVGLALAITALAKPRWGYTYDDVKRKGLDLILAVDTSRSMLSNDVLPNRLQRVKLATQDLISELQGDRVGLVAFAGRAFLQAPLTIDYSAAVEAINDLDTNTIPEGGTNISEAIELATRTFGKSAIGNRAVIIFTDGEELSGDALKAAKAATDAGVRMFTVGVGTPEGSLIPITTNNEGSSTGFVKDSKGQVVKSKLDEKRLRELAQQTGGFYIHLEDGPRTMKQLFTEGLAKMQAGDIDARLSRRPIERYQWPLGAALLFLATSFLMRERKRVRAARPQTAAPKKAMAMAATFLLWTNLSFGAAPGLEAYRQEKFNEAYDEFQRTLKDHPQTGAADEIQFDSGAAAYKMKDFAKALDSFSQALLSPDTSLQGKSHYNLGNTLYRRGETQKKDDEKLKDWTNALQHYEQALKIAPKDQKARENLEFVRRKIEELKQKREQQPPPSPSPNPQENKKDDQKNQQKDQQKDQQQQSKEDQQKEQKQDQSGQSDQSNPEKGDEHSPEKKEADKDQDKKDESQAGETPAPSPESEKQSEKNQGAPSPSPADQSKQGDGQQDKQSDGDQQENAQPPSDAGNETPAPSPANGQAQGTSPTPAPESSPGKQLAGEVKGAGEENPDPNAQPEQVAEVEPEKEGQMSEKQAALLLRSMKDEERRVQLDERKAARSVYNDW